MIKVLLALTFFILTINLYGQDSDSLTFPEVGKPMPNFIVRNIKYFSKKKCELSDFKGKWLLLDFWNKYCSACVSSFPRTNIIQKELGNKVQVILVGIQDQEGQIESLYEKFRVRQHLVMPCAFDSFLANRFDIYAGPHTILINEKGIVKCITPSINIEDMKEFLTGHAPVLPKAYRRMSTIKIEDEHYRFDPQKPFLIRNNGGSDTDFVFRSLLSVWDGNKHSVYRPSIRKGQENGVFQVSGVPLISLFNYAYWGVSDWDSEDTNRYGFYFKNPVLLVKDSSLFRYSYKYSKNIFSYSLIMPPSTYNEDRVRKDLQFTLTNYFGFEASIESRSCVYWKLVAKKEAINKLRTNGGKSDWQTMPQTGFVAQNWPFSDFIKWIRESNLDEVFFDETGINENVDITMDCIPFDLNDVQRALQTYGLELVKSEKYMKVLVIRDPKSLFFDNTSSIPISH